MYTIIIANAPSFDATPFQQAIHSADLVIATDGGGDALFTLGWVPHILIGDLDSISAAAYQYFTAIGVQILSYPQTKDATDLELALLIATQRSATHIDILGAIGGRWDQSFVNMYLLAMPELIGRHVRLCDTNQIAYLIRETTLISGHVGDIVSLLPVGAAAYGVTTYGLQYPLYDETLSYEHSRGISNVIVTTPASVTLSQGALFVIHLCQSDTANPISHDTSA